MSGISERLKQVQTNLQSAAQRHHRDAGEIALLAVSKTRAAEELREAYGCGQRLFGENYLGEAMTKMAALSDLAIEWHFIGGIQSNKTADIAQHFAWVHSVDRLKIARRLSQARPAGLDPLKVLIQVNISGEQTKGGIPPDELAALANDIAELPNIELRGVMALPAPQTDAAKQLEACRAACELAAQLAREGTVPDPVISLGTTSDFEPAIAAGSTMVRIGTAIFGPRTR